MALPNPTLNAPKLSSSNNFRRSFHARSPSHSPVRINPRDLDPLLRDLSPTTTLRFLSSDAYESQDPVAFSAENRVSSNAERALGTKAAEACLQLRSWARELESWEWPDTFAAPPSSFSHNAHQASNSGAQQWVCLAPTTVSGYEKRLENITQELADIDVEELKDYALLAHQSEGNGEGDFPNPGANVVARLEDVTTLITATIMQALPYLARVVRALGVWEVRLSICRQAPGYLQDLLHARAYLQKCWADIGLLEPGNNGESMNRDDMLKMKLAVQSQVTSLGRRLDRFLDALEGRDDTVPDSWIDDFEALERGYSEWTVLAERKVLQNEWQANRLSMLSLPDFTGPDEEYPMPDANELEAVKGLGIEAGTGGVEHSGPPSTTERQDPRTTEPSGGLNTQLKSVNARNNIAVDTGVPAKPRHVPIIVQYDGDGRDIDVTAPPTAEELASYSRSNRQPSPFRDSDSPATTVAKMRNAFLKGEIEKAESLQMQSKSPVRPFEHASTAFTRLFKRDKTPEAGRSSSPMSERSVRSISGGNKLERTTTGGSDYSQSDTPVPAPSKKHNFETLGGRDSPYSNRTGPQVDAVVSPPQKVAALTRKPSVHDHADLPGGMERFADSNTKTHQPSRSQNSVPETYRPASVQTYQPKRVSTPIKSNDDGPPEFPENWPLQVRSPSLSEHERRMPTSPLHDIDENAAFDMTEGRINSPLPPSSSTFDDEFTLDADGDVPPHVVPESYRVLNVARSAEISPARSMQRPRSAMALNTSVEVDDQDDSDRYPPNFVRRASYTSIESHPRSAVRAVTLSRRTSLSGKTPPLTPTGSRSASAVRASVGSVDELLSFPTPPRGQTESLSRRGSTERQERLTLVPSPTEEHFPTFESPVLGNSAGDMPILDGFAMRQRGKAPGSTSSSRPTSARTQPRLPEPEPDTFDRHVSEVLQTLQSNIKFRTRPGAETPGPPSRARTPEPRGFLGGKVRSNRVGSGSGRAVTIAPAEASPKKSSVAAEPVKLYHLRQEGREEPIKLFVRLVGEGERVMVRVGGGWADLADYLRQYAEHHGSRTVSASNNELEMLTSDPIATANTAQGVRRVSGPMDALRAGGKRPITPDPVRVAQSDAAWLQESQPRFTMGDSDEDSPNTKPRPQPRNKTTTTTTTTTTVTTPVTTVVRTNTPKSTASSGRGSRPGTSDQNTPTGANSSTLAGPASAKRAAGLADHKARWVEGMIEKAKASAEKDKSERDRYFGDMGKIGGTKRVVFHRSSSGTGG